MASSKSLSTPQSAAKASFDVAVLSCVETRFASVTIASMLVMTAFIPSGVYQRPGVRIITWNEWDSKRSANVGSINCLRQHASSDELMSSVLAAGEQRGGRSRKE